MELAELGFLWDNIAKLDSATHDSVKELYLPVEYDPAHFRHLEYFIFSAGTKSSGFGHSPNKYSEWYTKKLHLRLHLHSQKLSKSEANYN